MNTLDQFLTCMFSYYGKRTDCVSINVYRNKLRQYPIEEVSRVFEIHISDPDCGQFMPKIADFERIMRGTKKGNAVEAWHKVMESIAGVGPYSTLSIDDPWLHLSLEKIGGYQKLCTMTYKELDFKMNEFCKAYESFRGQGTPEKFPKCFKGIVDIVNGTESDPVLIGDPDRAKRVLEKGTRSESVQITFPQNAKNLLPNLNKQNPINQQF